MTPDLAGKRFGRLVVIERTIIPGNNHSVFWRCACDCGNETIVATSNLLGGNVKSCKCLRLEKSTARIKQAAIDNIKHGEARTNLYAVWHSMKQRCENPNNPAYKWYGGKGVKVCNDWIDYEGFAKWAYANGYIDNLGVPRKLRLSIDRIDSNGDYCPENCRWITVSENTTRATIARWENAGKRKRSGRTKSSI